MEAIKRITDLLELDLVSEIREDLESGNVEAFDYHRAVSYLEKLAKQLKEVTTDYALVEAEKYHKQELKDMGITVSNGRKVWKFDHYDGFSSLNERLKDIQNKMKAAANNRASILDEETGEVIPPAAYTYSKSSITIK